MEEKIIEERIMEEKKFLELIDKNGNKIKYEILAAFQLASTEKNYVIYTDNTYDEKRKLNVFAAIYYPDDDSRLDPIETEEEWDAVECVLASLKFQEV